ncbi:hypothetical protein OCK74_04360 [Chitinophagaceae bacterium LB-8]|uniref:Uncharacterized protein n=1 Tax=Paraflavisolibacter caeni TaxID=2982496 RepID=A0A9X3BGT5_9BACT|nr:hypothetical protein [Paraflavisolibacter caeni]MCU7548332.1 hypothetical protein [Paraflavisolibacter caeni]
MSVSINNKGFVTSIKDKRTNKEYSPSGRASALLSMHANKKILLPQSARFSQTKQQIELSYLNGAKAVVKVQLKDQYLRLQLESLTNRGDIDNIVWGPINTTISQTIGDIIGVVRDGKFAFGMMALNDITISGPPTESDLAEMYYYIHSPDPVKYPIDPKYKEGQRFGIGGDGHSDVAFYSHPEEYFRMNGGNGAILEPAFGSSVSMHARDRRKPYTYLYSLLPDFPNDGHPRHQVSDTMDVDVVGSAIALYGCPDEKGLQVIEDIVLTEGLPHPTIDGKWIKDPAAYKPDMAWSGVHDSTISYASQLGLKAIQDEGLGEYYANPADRWGGKRINFSNNRFQSIKEFTDQTNNHGIRYGLHTLCEFIQPHSSDVHPVPNDGLQTVLRTRITNNIAPTDTIITVADTSFLNEKGTWHKNGTNVLKIGKELLTYDGVTTSRPYTLLHVKRGQYKTQALSHQAGDVMGKLQINCYNGFVPDMKLQLEYADFYAKLLVDGGMDYIDFDGLESCMYQNQGNYSFKSFYRRLFDTYHKLGGKYLRVMGSTIVEGNWHYMSVCNVGGGDHMFSPVLNKWGIEGKDVRYIWESNYLPATFGIISLSPDWSVYDAENLQAKSIGWNATYMLGLSQNTVEKCAEKQAIFKAYRTWENARAANVFTDAHKQLLKNLDYKFHLEEIGNGVFNLYPIRESRFSVFANPDSSKLFSVPNEFKTQSLQFAAKLVGTKGGSVGGATIKLDNNNAITINASISEGQYLITENGKLYLADRNRKKLQEIQDIKLPLLSAGTNKMQWELRSASHADMKFEVVISSMGTAQKIGNKRI